MKFRYNGPDVGPIALTDLSSSIVASPGGIAFTNIVAQNQVVSNGPAIIELQDSDEVVKSYQSGQLMAQVNAGHFTIDVPPLTGSEFTPTVPANWGSSVPNNIYSALDQAALIASSYNNGTASAILLAPNATIGDSSHIISNIYTASLDGDPSLSLKVLGSTKVNIDSARTMVDQNLVVTGTLTLNGLSGILKANLGDVVGSATTTDLPEGTNLYFTQTRARTALSATAPISYNVSTGLFSLAGLSSVGSSNQILGVNAAGNAWEYKTLAGFAPEHISVNYTPNNIVLELPQAIAPTSDVTFNELVTNGLTTMNAPLNVTDTSDSFSPLSGSIITAGGVGIGMNLSVGAGITILEHLLGADGFSTLGDVDHSFSALFIKDKIRIQGGALLQIGHDSNDLVIASSGRVLIGTATDDVLNRLQVNGDTKITGNLEVTGIMKMAGVSMRISTQSSNYTLLSTDFTVEFTCGVSNLTATLPASPTLGQMFNICKNDSGVGSLTLNGNGKTINGQVSLVTDVQYFNWTIQYNGVEWRIL